MGQLEQQLYLHGHIATSQGLIWIDSPIYVLGLKGTQLLSHFFFISQLLWDVKGIFPHKA